MIYFKLFITFLKIGAFSFGGGYAMLPMINQEVVTNNVWVTAREFIDIVAISQITPGPIAINAATYIGYKTAGMNGSLLATLGTITPSIIIMIIICKFFFKFNKSNKLSAALMGLRPAVVGLIASAAVMLISDAFTDYKSFIIFIGAFIISLKFKIDPIVLTIVSGIIGFIVY